FLVQFNRIQLKEGVLPTEIEKKIRGAYERLIKSSAFTILHMKVLNSKESQPSNHYLLQRILLFLEQCVQQSNGRIEMKLLESCFPFTMIRTTFIQVYEKQTNNYSYAPVADDSG